MALLGDRYFQGLHEPLVGSDILLLRNGASCPSLLLQAPCTVADEPPLARRSSLAALPALHDLGAPHLVPARRARPALGHGRRARRAACASSARQGAARGDGRAGTIGGSGGRGAGAARVGPGRAAQAQVRRLLSFSFPAEELHKLTQDLDARRRGRPKGSKNKPKPFSIGEVTGEAPLSEAEPAPAPAKDKRGRKGKERATEPAVAEEDEAAEGEDEDEPMDEE